MNHKKIYISALFTLLLVGCRQGQTTSKPPVSSEPPIVTSSEEPTSFIPGERKGTRKLEFFGINDFHGSIIESDSEPGIFKIASYLKSRYATNVGGTLFLNAGDYWQGSADSNINRGAFLTRAMNELSLDAMTLGNHEFDWFDTAIMNNKALANYPFLGANILKKDTNELATNLVHYDPNFQASTIVTKNDVRVGIVGTIGPHLESSILATAVAPYTFEPVESYIQNEVTNLRKKGADVIALVVHDSLAGAVGSYTNILNDKLVDLVFSGHAHTEDNQMYNGIPILQTNGNGKQIMEVEATYNFDLQSFTVNETNIVEGSYIKGAFTEDVATRTLFGEYEAQINSVKNEVVGTLTSSISKHGLANLANKMMYEYAVGEGYPNVVSVHNTGGVRVYSIPAGEVTYGDIYKAFPFDNEVMLIENVLGSTLKGYISFHPSYPLSQQAIVDQDLYTVVTIDYVSFGKYSNLANVPQIHSGEYVRELIAQHFRDYREVDGASY